LFQLFQPKLDLDLSRDVAQVVRRLARCGLRLIISAMKVIVRVAVVVLFLPLLVYIGLALAVGRDAVWATLLGPGERGPVAFETLEPPGRPNRYLVCPRDLCRRAAAESPIFAASVAEQRRAWDRLLDREGARRLRDEGGQIEVEVRTPWLRFPDLVTIRPIPSEADRSTVAVYSRSLYGHSDFGVNAARVRAWLRALTTDLSAIIPLRPEQGSHGSRASEDALQEPAGPMRPEAPESP